mgnify:FL=1
MARMHSRKKGKSGSSKPMKKVPGWAPYKEKEVEKLVVKFAKAGKSGSQIGMILRDSYGINSIKAATNKNVLAILGENNLKPHLPDDMLNLIKKLIAIKAHKEKNKHDATAIRGFTLTVSKIRRLMKYYKRTKVLPLDWKLNMDRLKMYLE